tara:strand:- start:255 stop:1115 length:861 start_codon:yes stop_codon:yes gene_type:complete
MKILIPFSGGVNSTYSLYRWLSETDADIICLYGVDQWYDDKHNDDELNRARKIVSYLKSTVREFEFDINEWPSNYVSEEHPIRPGFKLGMWDVGKVRPRYEGYVKWQNETKTDGISIGLSLENTAMDCGYNTLRSVVEQNGMDIYLGGMPELTPVPQGDDFDWDYISSKMIGRFEQYESIPEELQSLVVKCNLTTCKKEKCRDCAYWRTYEFFVSEGKTGRDFDLYCAKHGSYGPWRHEADPETYLYRGARQSWLQARRARNRKLISAASREERRSQPTLPYLQYN